tara:strand:- start:23945 stop:24169 length:225 start_codon:yes stop_codon:yes gene_type:complete
MTFQEFIQSYMVSKSSGNNIRLGQYFINLFIKDSSSHRMQNLWNETQFKIAKFEICEYINEMQWDYENLPLLKK